MLGDGGKGGGAGAQDKMMGYSLKAPAEFPVVGAGRLVQVESCLIPCCYRQTVTILGTMVFRRVFQGALKIDVQKWICCFKHRVFTF